MSTKGSPEQAPSRTPPAAPHNPPPTGGPAPLPPQPEPPRISAAELALLTEAAATKNGTFQCTLCNKQFGYKNGLIRHVRLTHVGEKPYQCNICNRRFGYKHILMEHQNLHFGNRPYACNMCDKKFAARSNLIQHRMVHKRPFHCNLCNKRFDREDQLKKHLFAHPQSLLTCSVCKYTATSQKDLNKHMVEAHQPPPTNESSPGSATGDHAPTPDSIGDLQPPHLEPQHMPPNHNGLGHTEMARTEPITPPDSSEEQPQALSPPGRPPGMPPQTHLPSLLPSLALDPRAGYRIDAICSQLSSHFSPSQLPPNMYHGVIVKKEMQEEEYPPNSMGLMGQMGQQQPPPQQQQYERMPQDHERMQQDHERMDLPSQSPQSDRSGSLSHPPPPPQSAPPPDHGGSPDSYRNGPTPPQSAGPYHSPEDGHPPSLTPDLPNLKPSDGPQPSALPGIHEVFSRRGSTGSSSGGGGSNNGLGAGPTKLPPFPNFGMPLLSAAGDRGLPPMSLPQHPSELTLSMMSPPPPVSSYPNSSGAGPPSLSGGPLPSQRPTAQLPPITQVLRQTKDKGVQHSAPIPGFPSLDDVLSYYMNQGRLFKCQHCHIVFFERGMYFLHASLHGPSSPWECSICHKVCSDKNEFTLHFVNQQHNC